MVYLKVNNQYADGCFNHLERFLKIIDNELSEIKLKIKMSSDPDTDGILDMGEYIIGYGFVAIQRYVTSTYPQTRLKNFNYLKMGPQLEKDLYLIEAINAGANFWKHECEWPFSLNEGIQENGLTSISINRSGDNLEGRSKGTYDLITKLTDYKDYTLSNFLAVILKKLSQSEDFSFSPLLPFIEQWRNSCSSFEE